MQKENNPYQPPHAFEQTDSLYTVTPFRSSIRRTSAEVLKGVIDDRAKQDWRLATSFDLSRRYLVWRRREPKAIESRATPQYQILPLLNHSFLECLRRRSFRSGTKEVAEKLVSVSADWFVESYCSDVGYVLCQRPVSTMTEPNREDYSVLRRSPEWRRTLFGGSWMPVLANELSASCSTETEIVSYLGDDLFLIKKRQAIEQKQGSECRDVRRTYKLAMWPNWRSIVFSATPNIAPWFEQEASQGWELLSHYTGFIFLFRATT